MLIVNRLDEANCTHEAVHDGAFIFYLISVRVAEVTRTHITAREPGGVLIDVL